MTVFAFTFIIDIIVDEAFCSALIVNNCEYNNLLLTIFLHPCADLSCLITCRQSQLLKTPPKLILWQLRKCKRSHMRSLPISARMMKRRKKEKYRTRNSFHHGPGDYSIFYLCFKGYGSLFFLLNIFKLVCWKNAQIPQFLINSREGKVVKI